ncbi:hypothetical protein COLO4_03278 [Corchorus olitorius]|uniref:Uncharacterized protein n=1 Tax=Corchorus olitorius TaxID=93759 RepID=A0A1R3KZC7_9ROSI|nr:hypothetical protein COLO4_03278 [Corchorus olitorius]
MTPSWSGWELSIPQKSLVCLTGPYNPNPLISAEHYSLGLTNNEVAGNIMTVSAPSNLRADNAASSFSKDYIGNHLFSGLILFSMSLERIQSIPGQGNETEQQKPFFFGYPD